MKEELLHHLRQITDEEKTLLQGRQTFKKKYILPAGNLSLTTRSS